MATSPCASPSGGSPRGEGRGRVRIQTRANKALPQPVHTFWKCCGEGGGTDISIPAAVCAAGQPVRPNKQPAGGRSKEEERPHYNPPSPTDSPYPSSHSTHLPNNTGSWGCGCLTRQGSEMPTLRSFPTLTGIYTCPQTQTHTHLLFLDV